MHKIRLYPSWQYCFVLHDLHKACPRTTLYYQPSTKYFPLLLCTAMQMLHKALSSTCTPKLAQKHFHFIGARIIKWSVEQRVWSVECGRGCSFVFFRGQCFRFNLQVPFPQHGLEYHETKETFQVILDATMKVVGKDYNDGYGLPLLAPLMFAWAWYMYDFEEIYGTADIHTHLLLMFFWFYAIWFGIHCPTEDFPCVWYLILFQEMRKKCEGFNDWPAVVWPAMACSKICRIRGRQKPASRTYSKKACWEWQNWLHI